MKRFSCSNKASRISFKSKTWTCGKLIFRVHSKSHFIFEH